MPLEHAEILRKASIALDPHARPAVTPTVTFFRHTCRQFRVSKRGGCGGRPVVGKRLIRSAPPMTAIAPRLAYYLLAVLRHARFPGAGYRLRHLMNVYQYHPRGMRNVGMMEYGNDESLRMLVVTWSALGLALVPSCIFSPVRNVRVSPAVIVPYLPSFQYSIGW